MRQKTQTPKDAQLRTALINMRYGKCTPDDIKFLKSLVAGKRPGQPKVAAKEFRNVAIICGRHTQKDQINLSGCERFALETNQKLVDFYSIDKWGNSPDPALKDKSRGKNRKKDIAQMSRNISLQDQMLIWNLRPGSTDNFPGKLSICLGMPVMIRNNEATELCITKGQEGFVVGWQSITGPHEKQILDTLFVELDRPPRTIQIPGLPENVVPIVRDKKTIECTFPSDLKTNIEREQVWILPNFAMTDYASQGKTRPHNVVHLSSCASHLSYYTCLSRSASAADTIIIQGFEPRVVTSGCSGYLRQEFRELEILDDITRMRYESQLPDHIEGERRNTLIRQYQKWKGTSYVPEKTDQHLSWSKKKDMTLLPVVTDSPWQLIKKQEKNNLVTKKVDTNFVPAQGSSPLPISSLKRKFESENDITKQPIEKNLRRMENSEQPVGLIWDSTNYSCAYDSLLSILYDIWKHNPFMWNVNANYLGAEKLSYLDKSFNNVLQSNQSLEEARDDLRKILHEKDSLHFPNGYEGTSVAYLADVILKITTIISSSQKICLECDFVNEPKEDRLNCILDIDSSTEYTSTSSWLRNLRFKLSEKCPDCFSTLYNAIYYVKSPNIIIFDHTNVEIHPSSQIKYMIDGKIINLKLKGLIYHGSFHFTSRIISKDGDVWYNDGKEMGRECIMEGHRKLLSEEDWLMKNGRKLILSIYSLY
jgi:hypothetical protein